jgi:hypothetical protein
MTANGPALNDGTSNGPAPDARDYTPEDDGKLNVTAAMDN